ncbi:phage major capsid protein [Thermus tengchongensis]|uniref:Phage major capsid protein n=1 Tax=Thermus tengchongensis TaxID=1214928 RepID=A0A4Y9F8Z3_9DEIN|nr:phage major capsid protein [Thermus tengchongensis]TFU25636.1 phage major capsid protein [Thermus tengchongensis]
MPVTTRSDLFIPEVLADAVAGAWPNRIALLGTEAVVESRTLPGGTKGGDTIKVPYFGVLGEFEILAEGAALTPAKLTMTTEEAVVQRAGKLFEVTTWASMAAMYADPYAEATRQILEGARRAFDRALVDAAASTTGGSVQTVDASSGTINYDAIVDALAAFGENEDSVAAVVMHPKVLNDLRKAKSSDGTPIFLNPQDGGRPRVLGLPIIVSRRAPVISGTPNTYVTLFVRRGALALWYNGTPSVETDKDIAADTVLAAVNVYFVAHRYSRLPGDTDPVVVRLVTS